MQNPPPLTTKTLTNDEALALSEHRANPVVRWLLPDMYLWKARSPLGHGPPHWCVHEVLAVHGDCSVDSAPHVFSLNAVEYTLDKIGARSAFRYHP